MACDGARQYEALAPYLTPALLDALAEAVTVIGPDWRYRYVSPSAARVIGRPAQDLVGVSVWGVFPEVVGTPQHEALLRAMRERTVVQVVWWFEQVGRWYEQRAVPIDDGLVVLVDDVTDDRLATHRAERLVEIGEGLAQARTPSQVGEVLVRQAYPLVGAAGGQVLLADAERGVLSGVDGDRRPEDDGEQPIDPRTPAGAAWLTGQPVWIEEPPQDGRGGSTGSRAGAGAALPLTSAGTRLGVLAVDTGSRVLSQGDRRFLVTTAAIAAQALLRARLLDAEERSIAVLQHSLLPQVLPEVPGLSVAVRYVASDTATQVGGDWYDVVELAGGGVALVLGDVEGHDLGAAALMGLVRSAVRAYALEGHPPAVVAARANAFLVGLSLGRMVTLSYTQLHPLERLVTTVCAGHPATEVVGPDGTLLQVPSEVGPPLGVYDDGMRWTEWTSVLPLHCAFAMFTDGLIETRDADLEAGTGVVRRVLDTHRHDRPDALADALLAARGQSWDDVAILVGRLTADEPAGRRLSRRLPPTPTSVMLARSFARQVLAAWEVDSGVVDLAELVVSELVTNAARHSEEALQVGLSRTDLVLRVEVSDTSHRMPLLPDHEVPAEATSGRGLLLVDTVSSRWGVESEHLSKLVWAEFDLPG